jgi:hypothetical protein
MDTPAEQGTIELESEPFIIFPKWLNRKASPQAKCLYLFLKEYANNHTREAYPSRPTLAADMGFARAASVDPYIKELEDLGAITVTRKKLAGGKNVANVYTLHAVDRRAVRQGAPLNQQYAPAASSSTVQPQSVVRSSGPELIPNELILTELEKEAAAPAEAAQGELIQMPPAITAEAQLVADAQVVARRLVELHPALKYPAMMTMAKRMMTGYGVDVPTVGRAMDSLYRAGRPITDQTVGQALEGHVNAATGRAVIHEATARRSTKDDEINALLGKISHEGASPLSIEN